MIGGGRLSNRILIAVIIILMALVILALCSPTAPKSSRITPAQPAAPATATTSEDHRPSNQAPSTVFIGHDAPDSKRTVHSIFTTRKRDVLYQALVRYNPVDVRAEEVPGLNDIAQAYSRQGRDVP